MVEPRSVALPATASRTDGRLSRYAMVAGLGLAIAMLVLFHAMVDGVVRNAKLARPAAAAAIAARDTGCTQAVAANDPCMLQVAVSPRLLHPAGARTRGASRLDARAD